MPNMPARSSSLAFTSLLAFATASAALAAACSAGGTNGGSTFVEPVRDAAPDPEIDAPPRLAVVVRVGAVLVWKRDECSKDMNRWLNE
jgi:hypothetical protein